MTRISVEQISCPSLYKAYGKAMDSAIESSLMPPPGADWSPEYGNHVSGKGCLTGSASCDQCGKRIDLTLQLKKIDATDINGEKVKAFDLLDYSSSIKVSGVRCTKED